MLGRKRDYSGTLQTLQLAMPATTIDFESAQVMQSQPGSSCCCATNFPSLQSQMAKCLLSEGPQMPAKYLPACVLLQGKKVLF